MRIKQILESRSTPDENGCMNWLRCKNKAGYGQVRFSGKQWPTHRAIWEHYNGVIPKGMLVCHHCDNPACCNPEHLFVGTHLDNHRDKIRKSRQARGTQAGSAKLKDTDVLDIRRRYAEGISASRIAKDSSLANSTVRKIIIGLTWKHLPDAIEKTRNSFRSDSEIRKIRDLFKRGYKPNDIACKLDVPRSTVYHIATRRRRSSVA